MKQFLTGIIAVFLLMTQTGNLYANGIQISNVTVLPGTSQIQFDLSWQNSWRSNVLQNWDAAWIFIKAKDVDGKWKPVFPALNGNHTAPAGYTIGGAGANNGFGACDGLMVYRAVAGSGTVNLTGVRMEIPSYYASGVYDIRVFGIEMVYIPAGGFWVGDRNAAGAYTSFSSSGGFPAAVNGGLSDVTDPIRNDVLSNVVNTNFPTGYNGFYCMKYELSQGGYRDFLNTLTSTQQANHTANPPAAPKGTTAMANTGTGRPYIKISTPSVNGEPAVYGCDANGNGIFDEPDDGEWVVCTYLNWPDAAAYLAWAGLAPMTELQFEKICRGPQQPVTSEYAWGTDKVISSVISLTGMSTASESAVVAAAQNEGYAAYLGTAATPLRTGIFATSTSNRVSSGGSFYGVMDMSGNVWERTITTANAQGTRFAGRNANPFLSQNGYAVVSNQSPWPGDDGNSVISGFSIANGIIYRGGSSFWAASYMRVSDRSIIEAGAETARYEDQGCRGVRNPL